MTGARIRHARLAAGLTLDELSTALRARGYSVTKSALSKYELERSSPPASVLLLELSSVLQVPSSSFLEPPLDRAIELERFRKKSRLSVRRQEQIKASVRDRVERFLRLLELLDETPESRDWLFPREPISSPEQAEGVAEKLRAAWGLGDAPLESVCQLLEDHGVLVIPYEEAHEDFDGLSGTVQLDHAGVPLVIYSTRKTKDRQRLSMVHELGHCVMSHPEDLDERTCEKAAFRFSAAFLVPRSAAVRELGGSRRHSLDLRELMILKKKYGISMFAWVLRAYDLDIISRLQYQTWCRIFSARGWRRTEPTAYENPFEEPQRLEQLTLRALAERRISAQQALEFCPKLRPQKEREAGPPMSARRLLMTLPREEREAHLMAVAERAADDYLPESDLLVEAFDEDDLP